MCSGGCLRPGLTRFLKLWRGGGTHTPTYPLMPLGTALSHEDAELWEVKRQASPVSPDCMVLRAMEGAAGFVWAFHLTKDSWHSLGTAFLRSLLSCLRASWCCGQTAFPGHGTCSLFLLCCCRHSLMLLHLKGHCWVCWLGYQKETLCCPQVPCACSSLPAQCRHTASPKGGGPWLPAMQTHAKSDSLTRTAL